MRQIVTKGKANMKTASSIVLGIGILALSAGIVSATNKSGGDKPEKTAKSKQADWLAAIESLNIELQRRFHDRNNIDFGMSRIVRTGSRMHSGPTMDKLTRAMSDGSMFRQIAGTNDYEVKDDETGEWVPQRDVKQRMHWENDSEKAAIMKFDALGTDVSIYTFGLMSAGDDSEKRARGPAYLHQRSEAAPTSASLLDLAKKAYTAGKNLNDFAAQAGWRFYARRVVADDQSCINCHNSMAGETVSGHAKYKLGDTIGVLLIGIRDQKPQSR